MTTTIDDIDPITYEVVKHRLWQINDEQGTTIRTVSSSPIVTEVNDFNVGLFTAEGQLVSAGPYVLFHITTMDEMISNIREKATAVRPGDVFLCNDPDLGAVHQNDVAVVAPVFRDGDLVAWFSNTVHQADIGGITPGGFCTAADDTYDEPNRFFLKIVDEGEWSNEVEYTYLKSSRLPERVEIDLHAQTAAVQVADSRFQDICDKYDIGTVTSVMEQAIDFAESEIRDLMTELPDGEWSETAYIDGDGHTDEVHEINVTLRKEGEQFHFDYSGTDDQTPGALNVTREGAYAATTVPIYAFLCGGDIDWNAAVKRVVDVEIPPGTMVSAEHPAGVSAATVGCLWATTQISAEVLSELLYDSETHRDRVCPSWLAAWNSPSVSGTDRNGEEFGATLSDAKGGGAAARSFDDGFEHSGSINAPRSKLSNVETEEQKFPFMYLFREQHRDSGGPGKYRGGVSLASALVPHKADEIDVNSYTFGSDASPAYGIAGGYPGGGVQVASASIDNFQEALENSEAPLSVDEFENVETHSPQSHLTIGEDETFIFTTPGGGGFADPLDRDPERVETDVRTDRVSREEASKQYGVVFESDDGPAVDIEATESRRENIRQERLATAEESDWHTDRSCPTCGETPDETFVREQELRAGGRRIGLRYGGESPNLQLVERFCGCGGLIDVTQDRK